jgi:hypothetical protein
VCRRFGGTGGVGHCRKKIGPRLGQRAENYRFLLEQRRRRDLVASVTAVAQAWYAA